MRRLERGEAFGRSKAQALGDLGLVHLGRGGLYGEAPPCRSQGAIQRGHGRVRIGALELGDGRLCETQALRELRLSQAGVKAGGAEQGAGRHMVSITDYSYDLSIMAA